uniref:MFS domain-containing protein n=1 Tax=Syphacia muris TaxID=451379 RepID=A0A0N5AWC1_9BILA
MSRDIGTQGFLTSSISADQAWELVVSLRVYGLALGSILAIVISTYCGRRKPLIFAMTLELIGAVMSAFIRWTRFGIYIAFLGRFINGLGSGIVQVTGSAMTAEVPAARHRGTVLATHTIWACVGEFFGAFISMDFALGNERYWPIALAIPAALIPLCIICLWSSAESPRYLVSRNQIEEAKKALLYYQINDDYDATMTDMLSEVRLPSNQIKSDLTWLGPIKEQIKRFKESSFIRPLLVAIFTQNFVHLNDWLWILYSTQVFIKSGLPPVTAQTASMLMTVPQSLVSITVGIYFDNFSRRALLIAPTIASIFCGLLAVTRIRHGKNSRIPLLSSSWSLPVIATVDLCLAAIASESAYTVTPELFLQVDRAVGTAIVTFVQNVFGGILSNLQLTVINEYGAEYVLITFAVVNVFYVIGVLRILPETAHKTFQVLNL